MAVCLLLPSQALLGGAIICVRPFTRMFIVICCQRNEIRMRQTLIAAQKDSTSAKQLKSLQRVEYTLKGTQNLRDYAPKTTRAQIYQFSYSNFPPLHYYFCCFYCTQIIQVFTAQQLINFAALKLADSECVNISALCNQLNNHVIHIHTRTCTHAHFYKKFLRF